MFKGFISSILYIFFFLFFFLPCRFNVIVLVWRFSFFLFSMSVVMFPIRTSTWGNSKTIERWFGLSVFLFFSERGSYIGIWGV